MVPDLVREHVRLGEVAWCPEVFGQHLEELQVEVDAAAEFVFADDPDPPVVGSIRQGEVRTHSRTRLIRKRAVSGN